MKKNLFFLITALLLFSSCKQSQRPIDRDQITLLTKAANDASLSGHIEKDLEKIVGVYTEDAIVLPPGGVPSISGINAIREYYKKSLESPGKTLSITTEHIRYDVIDDKNVTELGSYVIRYQPSDTTSVLELKGEMLIVWKNIGGNWKIYLDMWH